MDPDRDRSSASTRAIPSFASLRDPGRRSPIDVLFAEEQRVPSEPEIPVAAPVSAAPRPPEWADLLHLAVHLARWSLELPARGLRRVLGG